MKKNRKKFSETRIGKFLKGNIREIPLAGGLIDNIANPSGGEGKLEKKELPGQIIMGSIVLLAALKGLGIIKLPDGLLQSIIDLF